LGEFLAPKQSQPALLLPQREFHDGLLLSLLIFILFSPTLNFHLSRRIQDAIKDFTNVTADRTLTLKAGPFLVMILENELRFFLQIKLNFKMEERDKYRNGSLTRLIVRQNLGH
jgi:hypothetical protein